MIAIDNDYRAFLIRWKWNRSLHNNTTREIVVAKDATSAGDMLVKYHGHLYQDGQQFQAIVITSIEMIEADNIKIDHPQYPCQLCGRRFALAFLFNLKGAVPGGAKVTCLECKGRLDERAEIRTLVVAENNKADAELEVNKFETHFSEGCVSLLAAIDKRTESPCPDAS